MMPDKVEERRMEKSGTNVRGKLSFPALFAVNESDVSQKRTR